MSDLHVAPRAAPAPVDSPAFLTHDAMFADVLGDAPSLERVIATDAHEGPVYSAAEDALYFTTVPRPGVVPGAPRVDITRLALDGDRFDLEVERLTPVRLDANAANGMTGDGCGGLIVCEQGSRRRAAAITRVDCADGTACTLVDSWLGLRLNSPNDVVVRRDGTIWFTDPSYGYLQRFRPARQPVPRPATPHHGVHGREPQAGRGARRRHGRARLPRRPEGRRGRPDLQLLVLRRPGLRARRQAAGRDRRPGGRELHLRRRPPQRPVHHHRRRRLGRRPARHRNLNREDRRVHHPHQDHHQRRRSRRRGRRRRA
jgi:hypothetical protein